MDISMRRFIGADGERYAVLVDTLLRKIPIQSVRLQHLSKRSFEFRSHFNNSQRER